MQVEAIRGIDCWMQSIFESEEAEEPLDDMILVAKVEQSTRTHMSLIVDDTLEGQQRCRADHGRRIFQRAVSC
jgi:hypothetical protein